MSMDHERLSVRELMSEDIDSIADYWQKSDPGFLQGMGVDLSKIPARDQFVAMLSEQVRLPLAEKNSYCIIWLLNAQPIGHSNINKIVFAEEAYMHLHLWNAPSRKKGLGATLVRMTLPYFLKNII